MSKQQSEFVFLNSSLKQPQSNPAIYIKLNKYISYKSAVLYFTIVVLKFSSSDQLGIEVFRNFNTSTLVHISWNEEKINTALNFHFTLMTRWEEMSEDSKEKKKRIKVKGNLSFGIISKHKCSSFWKDIL